MDLACTADSVVLADFLHVLGPIEGLLKCLVSFDDIAVLLTHPGVYFALACLALGSACLSIWVDKVE